MIGVPDERIRQPSDPGLIELVEGIAKGEYVSDEYDRLLVKLARDLHQRYLEIHKLEQITENINTGLILDEVLDNIYENFKEIIPYDRIGFTQVEDDGMVVARWSRSDFPEKHLFDDFAISLRGSTFLMLVQSGKPAVINNMMAMVDNPKAPPDLRTDLLLGEGIQSMMTCPLIANGVPIGFLFFSYREPNVYQEHHIEVFQKIASRLSIIVEKGRLVSEILENEQAMEAQNDELQRLNEMKNALLGMAVHDLRNPLNAILMVTQLMQDCEDLDEENRWLLGAIYDRSEYMMRLINDLLDVSNIEAGNLTVEPEPVDVVSNLQEAAQDLNRMCANKGTTIVVEAEDSPTLTTDPHRLRQVIDNLLSNAVKYSPPGTIVTLQLARQAERWEINVADEGPGIPPDEREKLFKPFARLSPRPTGDESSTGLGLTITRRVVEALGGEIGMHENEPKGSVFWFTLPAE